MRQIHEDEAADYAEQMAIERYPRSYYEQDMMDDAAPADAE